MAEIPYLAMIAEAARKHGPVRPCAGRTFDECFTREGEAVLFWFNDSRGSTRIVARNL